MRYTGNPFITPTPEQLAARELQSMRLILFQAERQLVAARIQVDYCRRLIAFFDAAARAGGEHVTDPVGASSQSALEHRGERSSDARAAPGLTTIPSAA